jgi:ATP-dependent exoDNAse (exonuclease V) beta subunit
MTTLSDHESRHAIETATDRTLFVNAGAGSGKTTALVDRIATLVLDDLVPLRAIAAVTFTEKAGAELRDRLRHRFEQARRHRRDAGLDTDLADAALDDLDAAAIGTLHSFAQRILMEHPIEAGLPPSLEVLDEVGSSVAFEDRWAELQTELLDDDDIAEALMLGMACNVKLKHVRSLAHLLGSDWDLIEDRILVGADESVQPPQLDDLIEQTRRVAARAEECRVESDTLLTKLREIAELGVLLKAATDAEAGLGLLRVLGGMKFGSVGQKHNWPDKAGLVDDCTELAGSAATLLSQVLDRSLRALTRWTARRVLEAAHTRRAEGRLEFHDLLVLARDLLRRDADVRASLHERYQRLLLDEFQDTDPIQIELAVRIAGGRSADAADWRDVQVPAGRIFVVGDPKQSIYRFRRASIATYLDAEQRLGDTVSMTTNFRTVPEVLTWVNTVFGSLIRHHEGGQPRYEPLDAHRCSLPTDRAGGPAVTVLGADAHTDLPRAAASLLREREAADVAAVVRHVLDEGWQVFDGHSAQWRAARPDDIAILVPARTSLPFLEDALDTANVEYRAEASSLVYQADEVRSLLACARAIADPSDGLSLVAALRSPLFGCGDDDLWTWKCAGGGFNLLVRPRPTEPANSSANAAAEGPVATDHPVAHALDYLRRLHYDSRWLTPSEVLGTIITDRRMLEVAATGPRSRDSWRRLRFVVDQARAWSEVSHGGLRGYLAWAALQGQEATRAAEAVLPETDTDAVKVMTIHAAKGLEFPIVVLSGMTSAPYSQSGVRVLWTDDGGYAVKFGKDVETDDFEAALPVDEQMDALEKNRLLYVAATRARDHLVVSLHRDARSKRSTAAQALADAGAATASPATRPPSPGQTVLRPVDEAAHPAVTPPPEWQPWITELRRIRERVRQPAALSASGLEGTEPEIELAAPSAAEKGKAKGPRDVELPPWSKGRYGSAIGRAVHGVLQIVDLSTGAGLDEAVVSQCLAEGVTGEERLVERLARSALDSEVVRRAAEREHWRESYVGTVRADGTVLEGFVDLVYREDDGSLVVVDYKTDAVPSDAVSSRVDYYRPQLVAYADCLTAATSAPVTSRLLFLNPGGSALDLTVSTG